MEQAVSTPEDLIVQLGNRLLAVQHAVAEITGGRKVDADPQALADAVLQIRQIVNSIDGAYACFIGGLAVQQLGYLRWTDDVDVVVDQEHFSEVLSKLRESGFVLQPDYSLKSATTGARVDMLKEGVALHGSSHTLPHPRELGKNTDYASFQALVFLKLCAGRMKDMADVVELLKRRFPEAAAVGLQLPDQFKPKFNDLVEQARKELNDINPLSASFGNLA